MNSCPLYGIARWPLFRGSVSMEVYVSSVGTKAFGRYIAGVCCSGVVVKKGSTVNVLWVCVIWGKPLLMSNYKL